MYNSFNDYERNTNTNNEWQQDVHNSTINNEGICQQYQQFTDMEWDAFVIDIETTGMKGIPTYSLKNAPLEIECRHIASNKIFRAVCNPNIYVPDICFKYLDIDRNVMNQIGKPPTEIMIQLRDWINAQSNGKWALLIAHNIEFDFDMILKYLPGAGKTGSKLKWALYCTLRSAKEKFPYLEEDDSISMPYSLQSLTRYFFPETKGHFHNSKNDVSILTRLFMEKLLPIDRSLLSSTYWRIQTPSLLSYRPLNINNEPKPPILTLLRDIKGYKSFRVEKINMIIQDEFLRAGPYWKRFIVPSNLLRIDSLFQYGWMRTVIKLKDPKNFKEDDSKDAWFNICKEIEILLRTHIDIHTDDVILEPLKYITDSCAIDLIYHTIHENSNKQFFPTMPGEPISYLPLEFDDELANCMYKKLGYGTIHELLVGYLTKSESDDEWFKNIATILRPQDDKAFNKVVCMKLIQSKRIIDVQ